MRQIMQISLPNPEFLKLKSYNKNINFVPTEKKKLEKKYSRINYNFDI